MSRRTNQWMQQGESLFATTATAVGVALPRASSALVTASHYAVQKRILVPAWWLSIHSFRANGNGFSAGNFLKPDDLALVGPAFPQKFFHLVATIWNELFKVQAEGSGMLREVEIPLDKLLRGTCADLTEQLRVIEEFWSASYRCLRMSSGVLSAGGTRKTKIDAVGTPLSAVWRSSCLQGEHPKLLLHFSCTLNDFLNGRFFADFLGKSFSGLGSVVSLNPDVLSVLAQGRSPKKLSAYLFVEFSKRRRLVENEPAWNGGCVSSASLLAFHKDLLGRTKSLYDHGVFGWYEWAPRKRISTIRGHMGEFRSDKTNVLHLFRVSDHALAAARLEDCMSQTSAKVVKVVDAHALMSGSDRMISIRSSVAKNITKVKPEPVVVEVKPEPVVVEVKPEPVVVEVKPEPVVRCGAQAELSFNDDFWAKMVEYLQSLSPDEQQALSREQARMSQTRFKSYMARKLGMRPQVLSDK